MNRPYISAVICTYNRSNYLSRAIESLLNQTLDKDTFEIVVVDNASTDDTASAVNRIIGLRGAQIHYVYENRLGLSYARNAGIAAARGDIIAFMDDDAWAAPEWLAALLRTYQENLAACAVGGRTLLDWEVPRPDWLDDGLLPYLGFIDWGNEVRQLEWPEYIAGENCSFKRQTLEELGWFSTALGRRGAALLAAEETELQLRLHRAGKAVFYQPAAVVYHAVSESRVTKSSLRKRVYWAGVADSMRDRTGVEIGFTQTLGRVLRHMVQLPLLKLTLSWLRADQAQNFRCQCAVLGTLGFILQELRSLARINV